MQKLVLFFYTSIFYFLFFFVCQQERDNGDQQFTRESKWAEFIGEPDDISEEDIPDYSEKFNGKMVTTERPEVKRRGNSRYSTKKRRRSLEVAISAEQRDGGCFDDSEQPLGSKRMAVTSSSEYSFSSAGNFQDRFGGVAMSCQRSNCGRLMNSNVETMFAKETSKYSHPSQILSSNDENCEGTTEGLFQGGKLEVVETKTRKYNNNSDHCSARSKFADKTNNNRVNRHVDSGVVSIRSLQRSENFVQLSDFPRTSDCANQVKDIGAQSQNSKSADKATKVVKKSSKWSDFLDDEDNTIAEEDVYKDERDRKPDSTKGVTIGNAENLFCLQDELDEDFLWTDE